jgi:lactate dehydrogenase-like 2-hydroxyacid dehydrogenase
MPKITPYLGSKSQPSIDRMPVAISLTTVFIGSTMPLSMFTKMLCLNYEEEYLPQEHWKRIDKITKEKVLLPADSPGVKKHLQDADCLLLKLGMAADKALIDSMPRLKYIGMHGTGFGRIDAAYAAKKGITVTNIPGYARESVAEFVFAALLECFREITRAKIQAQTANFSEAGYTGTEIKGKTFGVIGLGRIGGRVAELAKGFGANVVYWSHKRKIEAEKSGIKYTDADTLVRTSDIISIHMSFNPETKGFLDAKRIAMIKSGAVIINTAPMELVDIAALEKRLKKGDITFILDHSDELDPAVAKRLLKLNNCILYPPIAYTTKEATKARFDIFVSNLENFLKGKATNKVY